MTTIVSHIIARKPVTFQRKLGFSIWAKSEPKDYLVSYPEVARQLSKGDEKNGVELYALVDDVWPALTLSRTPEEQARYSSMYLEKLPELGFDHVYLVSDFACQNTLLEYLKYSNKVNMSQFIKLLPQHKKGQGDLGLDEVLGFLWHLYVLDLSIQKFDLSGFIAGIRSEYFYLAARQVLPSHDVFFLKTVE